MASEKPDKKEKKEKHKDKKDKEGKHSSEDGVRKSKKESKKEKRDKTAKLAEVVAANEAAVIKELDARLQADAASQAKALPTRSVSVADVEDGEDDGKTKAPALVGALVPFAKPLADEKAQKKVLKGVRKSAKAHTLRRGVKEVVKALRKSPVATISGASASALPPGVVILAGDISPADIISHIPVLCEDHGVPYIFVPSRAELGAASAAKRPTSVVMVTAGSQKKKDDKAKKGETSEAVSGEDEAAEFAKVYEDLVRLVQKEVVQLRPYL